MAKAWKDLVVKGIIGAVLVSSVALASSPLTQIEVALKPYEVILNQDIQQLGWQQGLANLPTDIQQWVKENAQEEYVGYQESGDATYLLIARGAAGSSGYGIEIEGVDMDQENAKAIVHAKFTNPDPDQMYLTVITYPAVLLKLDKVNTVECEISGK